MFGKLLLLFILVPLAELVIFIMLGDLIGLETTIVIIILTAILGAALTKSQGRQAMARLQTALAEGRMPHREAADGILILIAGAVLLTPGFLTDTVGFLLLVPAVRSLLRDRFASKMKDKIKVSTPGFPPEKENQPSNLDDGNVIDV
ncbi:MAG: FxsA family protein [Verrucomicrobiaceae bacterium]